MNKKELIRIFKIKFDHAFHINVHESFDIKKQIKFIRDINFPLSQLYFFTADHKVKNMIKKNLLPAWYDYYVDTKTQTKFYVNYNSTLENRFEHKKQVKNINPKLFCSFIHKYKCPFRLRDKYYTYIDKCGVTYETLIGFGKYIHNIEMLEIFTEVAPKWKGQKTQDQVFDLLNFKGLKLIDIQTINHYQNKSIWIKK